MWFLSLHKIFSLEQHYSKNFVFQMNHLTKIFTAEPNHSKSYVFYLVLLSLGKREAFLYYYRQRNSIFFMWNFFSWAFFFIERLVKFSRFLIEKNFFMSPEYEECQVTITTSHLNSRISTSTILLKMRKFSLNWHKFIFVKFKNFETNIVPLKRHWKNQVY